MRLSRQTFVAIVWIALCAMLMAALAPSVSRILASHAPSCHVAGDMAPATGHAHHHAGGHGEAGGESHKAVLSLDECGYCTMQADLPMLPPVPPRADLAPALIRFAPPLFYLAPRLLFAWLGARSRAPPQA
jgi:hypothetical protein